MRLMSCNGLVSILLLGVLAISNARGQAAMQRENRPPKGVIFIVGGVGGFDLLGSSAKKALPKAKVPHEIRAFVWTHGWGHVFKDLQDTRHLLSKSEELADEIRRVKARDPDRPIYIVAKSGGTGLALAATELLPPNSLERIILLSAAVSPSFDLRPALRATKGEIVSFYSMHDWLILGWGTSHFGTVDRKYGPSAGLRRFKVPANASHADLACYSRLVQIPWSPRMLSQGHTGAHFGTSLPAFLAKEVVPWLKP